MEGFGEAVTTVVVAGLLIVKAFTNVAVPPPGALLVTETLRVPGVAVELIVTFAVICVALFMVTVFTVTSAPKLTELTPLMKLLPVKTTSRVCDRFPLAGVIDVSVGVGLLIVNSALVAAAREVEVAVSV